jgi:hypothetical protein
VGLTTLSGSLLITVNEYQQMPEIELATDASINVLSDDDSKQKN